MPVKAAACISGLFLAGVVLSLFALWYESQRKPVMWQPPPGFKADGSEDPAHPRWRKLP